MVLQKTWNNTVYNIPQSGERGWANLTNFLTALADGAQTTGKQIIGRRTAVATPVTVTATTDAYVGVNVSLAASVVNLPVGVNGQVFIIADESGAGGTYNITINPNGANTINGTTSYVMDLDKQVVYLVFNNGNWVVLSTGTDAAPISNVTDSTTIDFTLTPGNLTAIVKLDSLDNTHINTTAAIEYSKLDLTDGIVNADINAAAAIAYVKLNLADGIVNADINSAAAIAYSKLNLSGSILNADINAAAAIVYSKLDLTGGVVDADVNAAAAIARTKLGLGTVDHVVINDGSGAFSSEAQLASTRGGTGISSTATFPASGVIVTEDATQTLTNKTISGTVTSDYQQFTNTTVPATPAAGSTRIYASSVDKKFHYVDDAGTDTVIGSGSGGGGGKNYLESYADFSLDPSTGMVTNLTATGNRTSNTTVWGANTTSLLSQTATALRGLTSAQLVNGSSASNFIESPMFTLDTIDVNTNQLFISFDSNSTGTSVASGDWLVQIIRYDSGGTFVENISPSITSLPSGYYNFKCAWSHSVTATDQYALRFRSNTATARTLTIDTLVVGPQVVVESAAIGAWQAYTPTVSSGFGTATSVGAMWRRVGDSIEVNGTFVTGSVAAALGTVTLPGSLTIDSTKLSISANVSGANGNEIGQWYSENADNFGNIVTSPGTSTSVVYFTASPGTTTNNLKAVNANVISNNTRQVAFHFKAPIAQWTTNVTLAGQAQIEYASNSSATDGNDTTSFVNGATGSAGILSTTALSAPRTKRVRFQTPIQPTDRVQIEIFDPVSSKWFPVQSAAVTLAGGRYASLTMFAGYSGAAADGASGMGLLSVSGSSTDVDVVFNRYAGYTTETNSFQNWNVLVTAGIKWRVAKYSAVGLAELAPATATSSGTIPAFSSGSYTPTFTQTASVWGATLTSITAYYVQVGNIVHVAGQFVGLYSAAYSSATVTIPVARSANFSANSQCSGTFMKASSSGTSAAIGNGSITSSSGAQTVLFESRSSGADSTGGTWTFNFTYSLV